MAVSEQPAHLADMVRALAKSRDKEIALEFEGRQTSFTEFDVLTNRVANGLKALGVRPRERIAYLGKNSDVYFELMLGAMKANVVMTPVNWRLAAPEIAFIVADCKAAVLFVGPENFAQVAGIQAPDLRVVIATEGKTAEWQNYTTWRDAQSSDDPRVEIGRQDVAIQLYTSGTTGKPKGAMLSHANLLNLLENGDGADADWNRWTKDDVSLVAMPVFHIGGSGWGLLGLYHGAKGVIAREFDPTKVLDFIEHDKITKIFMVPAAMQFVVRQPRARSVDFSRLKHILYGASPIPAALLKECIEVFGCGFVQLYGMTETTGTIVALPPEDHVEGLERMRSAGKALPGVELAILDVDGKQLPPGEVGEIATRSGSNMVGYWNLPEATAKTIGRDGWLRTGDAGYMDKDGYLYVQDRIKDMIISGGENIYPAEVESAVCDHPDVAEAAVIGVPDDTWGETVKAIVVLKPGKQTSASDIINFTRTHIAAFKTPKTVDFIDALPRNASGKILRRHLRDPYWTGRERQVN
ncbi:fatty acid--CoA ligase [Bradyrhizobium sp.]|uniref:fatty acid--CoA ligase n=1 Tax=Bradyrhizobium sp. TaxID=376 RepID=UPI0026145250|nr:fatty acid--CoA ligase [Bradyrhizobium sp.]